MFIARCKSCGTAYYGCALRYTSELKCTSCGSPIVIINSGNEAVSRQNTKDSTILPASEPRIQVIETK